MKNFGIVYDDYFMSNLWWIIAVSVGCAIGLYFLISRLVHLSHQKKAPLIKPEKSKYLAALGGEENIISSRLVGSRIVLVLHDYTKINRPLLEEAGVTGFIEKSDQLTLVIKDQAQEVYATIFPQV
jgi:phosphotransferase system IIB component